MPSLKGDSLIFLLFLLAAIPLILLHELGHFLTCKWFGIRVYQFAIGFGKSLFSFKSRNTEYRLNLIPLGGYVNFISFDTGDTTESGHFLNQTRWRRFLVYAMGPVVNLGLAFAIFWFLFTVDPQFPSPGMPSDLAEDIAITSTIPVVVSAQKATIEIAYSAQTILSAIADLATLEKPIDELSGFIEIGEFAQEYRNMGWTFFLYFVAILSLNIGLLNLLPIPVLDGGEMLLLAAEGIAGCDLGDKIKFGFRIAGFAGLFALIVWVNLNELVTRLSGIASV